MSKCVRSARVRRVSSHVLRSTSRRTRSPRRVMSSRLPIGVATTKSVPLRLRRLLLRFRDEQRPLVVQDDLARNDALLEPLDGRQVIHDLEHDLLQDRPEPTRAGPPLERLPRDGRHRVVRELQADLPTRASMILSRPTKAPPQRKRTFDVSTWMNSWCGCFRPPWGGTLATVPSRILSRACWTPSPETSRVIEGFSDLRAILSISSI